MYTVPSQEQFLRSCHYRHPHPLRAWQPGRPADPAYAPPVRCTAHTRLSVCVFVCVCLQSWGAPLGRIGPLPKNGQDFLVPTSKRAHVWPFEMKGTKRNQKLKQPGLQGHTKRSREPALKQEGILSGPKCVFTSARRVHPLLHLKVRHVGHGIRPIKQVSVPTPD